MTSAELSAPESCFSFLVLMQTVNVWQWRHWYVVVIVLIDIITTTIIIMIIDGCDCELRSWS
jgi:hypothetical protein